MMHERPSMLFLHPSDELYGADRSLLAMVAAARDLVTPVVVLPDDLPYGGALRRRLSELGVDVRVGPVPVIRRQYLRPSSLLPWLWRSTKGTWWLLRIGRETRTVAIVSNTTAVIAGPVVARLLGRPHAWYIRELIDRPRWFRGFVRMMARLSAGPVIAVSQAVADWIGPISHRGPIVRYNGVDLPDDLVSIPSTPKATFVGRINAWKGQEVFIEAAKLVHDRMPEATFRLVGGTVAGDATAELRLREHLSDRVGEWLTWVGEVGDSRAEMRDAWVVVVPSTKPDPFPNVVLEAMSEGRAVVGSNLGGISEMVKDGETGILVAAGDSAALADALTRVLSDKAHAARMGQRGFERARAVFSRERFVESWRKTLQGYLLDRSTEERISEPVAGSAASAKEPMGDER
jgi:glycosyltransferase involved in cell wall biosynthesis